MLSSREFTAKYMNSPSETATQSDSLNMKRVQRISMQYENKNITPTSPIAQKKLPPSTPRAPRKIHQPSEDGVSKKKKSKSLRK